MSINKVMITGNLTRDPEMRASKSGTSVMRFGVAVNERVRQQDGSWSDKANFVDCVMFGTRADALSRYLSKGTKVAIEGRLSYSDFTNKDGQRRTKLEVIVNDLDFMSSRNGNGNGGYEQPSVPYSAPQAAAPAPQASVPPAPAPAPAPAPQPQDSVVDTDIPF